jgi:CheY-like chemotaxis protein
LHLSYRIKNWPMLKRKVLFVDDDLEDLQLIREVLDDISQAYEVEEAHNGLEALECLEKGQEAGSLPCLIVMDINMPVMDGKRALSIIKSSEGLQKIPIVLFTTSVSEADQNFCKRYGVEMITKPPSYTALQQVVKRLMGACRL